MKNLDEELEQAFELEIPEPDLSKLDQFDELLARNKKERKKFVFFQRFGIACALIVICLSCFIPIILNNRNPETVRYYGDDDVTQIEVSQEFVQTYINSNIPNYNFIFEDYTTESHMAIYDKETETNLLALSFTMHNENVPFTTVNVNIVLNKNYTFSEHLTYINEPDKIEVIDNMKIYTTQKGESLNYSLLALIDRSTYNTYLQLNANDTDIINKFTQN